jgi:hypothetical protein
MNGHTISESNNVFDKTLFCRQTKKRIPKHVLLSDIVWAFSQAHLAFFRNPSKPFQTSFCIPPYLDATLRETGNILNVWTLFFGKRFYDGSPPPPNF